MTSETGEPGPAIRQGALEDARDEAAGCHACPLWEHATQTVFGAGPAPAALMLVGEQPGDQEDRRGEPFVGPAGRLLDQALDLAGIQRDTVYVTNAVKHFKWEPAGKRRLHKKPSRSEAVACRPWLERELALVTPDVVVVLGSTAAQSLVRPGFRITQSRGSPLQVPEWSFTIVATVHPSSILRVNDAAEREQGLNDLVADLRAAKSLVRDGLASST